MTVRLGGPLGAHLAAAVDQLSRSTPYSIDLIVQDVRWAAGAQRLFQDYRGDLSGRYLDAVCVAHAENLPVDRDKAEAVLREILRCQTPDGFFGPPMPAIQIDHGSAWGHGRLLDGLLAARDWAPESLHDPTHRAATALVEAICRRADDWAGWVRAAAGQKFQLDPLSAVLPLARYAEREGAKPALAAARTLADALPTDPGNVHMHGYLLALRGLLEIGRLDGADEVIEQVLDRVDRVAAHHLLPHGGVLESLRVPWDANTEGCGIADWVMLNLRLYAITGAARHLDRAALAAFNALLHIQRPSGHFGCETLYGNDGLLVSDYAPEAWWCCTFHGIRALRSLAEHATTLDDDAVRVDLPIDLTRLDSAGAPVLVVRGGYPYSDIVTISAGPAFPRHERLRVRVPPTATIADVMVADRRLADASAADGWLHVDAVRPGTEVSIRLEQHDWFAVGGRAVLAPYENTTAAPPDFAEDRCALFHGPLLVAAHARDNDLEDVLRARYIVHPPDQSRLQRDDTGHITVIAIGHDTFRTTLRLRPLADHDRVRNDRPVRISFAGLLYAERTLHGITLHELPPATTP